MSNTSGRAVTRGAARVSLSLGLTWWYTLGSILLLQLGLLGSWTRAIIEKDPDWSPLLVYAAAGAVWSVSSAFLLQEYRNGARAGTTSAARRLSRVLTPWAGSAVAAAVLCLLSGSVLLALAVVAQPVCLLRVKVGARRRISALVTLALAVVAVLEATRGSLEFGDQGVAQTAFAYAVVMAPLTAFTLWWWDLVEELNRARLAEGRLAATQERLRVASDVHDLQGHHLQVIALQLELAERLLATDQRSAAEQIRAARSSVDEARQGTRDLATRFRGVPLPDELANAADLMHAADLRVGLDITPDAVNAPAHVLGPVVRETTTNVLKHGAGSWVELSLMRDPDWWTYRVSNDLDHDRVGVNADYQSSGSGIAGIVDRVRAVGGDAVVERTESTFAVRVTVPSRPGEDS